jgi:hypothetical protein
MVPDLNYEYHTITIDSNGQAAANTFTSYLEVPLKNVVEARLLASHIHTKTSNQHIYISIRELDSNFNDRATPVLNGAGTIGNIKGVFASIASTVTAVGTGNHINNFVSDYDVSTQYINPIRKVDRFTVNIYNQAGDLIEPNTAGTPNYLIIKFTCMKQNL